VNVEDLLHRLAEADSDRRRPELCDGRYLLTYLLPGDGAGAELAASSLYDLLDEWAKVITGPDGLDCDDPAEVTADIRGEVPELDDEDWLGDDLVGYAPALRELRSPVRRILGYFLVGLFSGPMTVVETDHRRDFYLGHALEEHPGGRFLFLMSADRPNQDEAWAILELG
jgi:hypothetical protein